jgi:hypothetical protein
MAGENIYVPSSALDSFAFALNADIIPEIGTRNPLLQVKLKLNKNKPQFSTVQFVVTHYIRGEEKYKTIELETKLVYAKAALKCLENYSNKPFDQTKDIQVWEVKAPKKVNGKMTSERITAGKLVVGRNEKGVFISVVHWNDKWPHIAFYPGNNDQMNVVNPAAGDQKRQYEYVCNTARGWADTVGGLLVTEFSHGTNLIIEALRRQKEQNGGGQGSSYGGDNYNNNNNVKEGSYDYGDSTTESYSSSDDQFNF